MAVLIVECDENLRCVVEMILADAHIVCDNVTNAADALSWLASHPTPALLIVSDFSEIASPHPAVNGSALLRQLDTDDSFWRTHTVLALVNTERQLPRDVVAILTRRQIITLMQPFDVEDLLDTVYGCLAIHSTPYTR